MCSFCVFCSFSYVNKTAFIADQMSWSQIRFDNNLPARVGHKCLCMPYRHDNGEEDEIIIFGGGDNDGAFFDDLYSIYVPFNTDMDSTHVS